MYCVKRNESISKWSSGTNSRRNARVSPISFNRGLSVERLARAISEKSLEVHYQPQIDLKTGCCAHLEALVRWNDPELGWISPSIFIPIAEEKELIEPLTHLVIDKVEQDILGWVSSRLPIGEVAVNISGELLSHKNSAERLLKRLERLSCHASFLQLEITETAIVQKQEMAKKYLHNLSDSGFRIALDDFGSGYSSLAYLLDFPINTLKMDKCFASSLSYSSKCQKIMRSVINLSKVLEMDIVAEGVESLEQAKLLKNWGCTLAQGFFFSKPLPKEDIARLNFASHFPDLRKCG